MKLDIAIALIERFEGFRASPYLCPANVWTIGFGSTTYADGKRVTRNDPPMTKETARALVLHDLEKTFLPGVLRLCPKIRNDEKKLNAIVDFAYNVGLGNLERSTLRRRIDAEDWEACKVELRKWVRGGGKVLPGLIARREAECELF